MTNFTREERKLIFGMSLLTSIRMLGVSLISCTQLHYFFSNG